MSASCTVYVLHASDLMVGAFCCNYAIIMYVKSYSAAVGYVVFNCITLLFDLSRLYG